MNCISYCQNDVPWRSSLVNVSLAWTVISVLRVISVCVQMTVISVRVKMWGISWKHSSSLHVKGIMCEIVVLCSSKNARQLISWHEGGRTTVMILLFIIEVSNFNVWWVLSKSSMLLLIFLLMHQLYIFLCLLKY